MKRRTRILQSHKAFPEDGLYMAGWCILALAAFLILIKNIFFPGFLVLEHMRPCLLRVFSARDAAAPALQLPLCTDIFSCAPWTIR